MSSLFSALRGDCDLQKLGSFVGKELTEVLRRRRNSAWASHCATKAAFGNVRLLPEASRRPAPRMTFREYAHISAARGDREVICKDGKWRLASTKVVSDDVRKETKEKFLEFMNDSAKHSSTLSARINIYKSSLMRKENNLNVLTFTRVFNNKEIEPYLKKSNNQLSPSDVDSIMKRLYGDLIPKNLEDNCVRRTKYEKTGKIFSEIRNLRMPDMGECDTDTKKITVLECFLSTDTLLHEAHHAVCSTDFQERYGSAFDEGVTQYFASKAYREERRSKYAERYGEKRRGREIRLREKIDSVMDGYGKAVRVARELAGKLDDGENLLKRAYFKGKLCMDELEAAFDRKYGAGSFSRFLEIVHTDEENLSLGRKRYKAAMAFLNTKPEIEED